MYEVFFQKLNEKVSFTKAEEAFVQQFLTPKKLRRRQYLLQEGDICKSFCMVEKGALRAYVVDEKGNEHITQFALEGWTTGDLTSFLKEEPATFNVDAIEDSELVMISKYAYDELLHTLPKFGTYFRLLVTDAYMALQKRIANKISLPVEEQYLAFTKTYPTIAQRVPQHMIASYIGFSPETLSRVRSRISNKK